MVLNTGFLAFVQGFGLLSRSSKVDCDFTDRLNSRMTVIFIVILSIMVSSNQYLGNPIHCWVPAEFSGFWQDYTNNYCWIKNTYWLYDFEENLFPSHSDRSKSEINYYQWVPIVLLIQAVLFYLPSLVWKLFNWSLGLNVQEIINKAMTVCSSIRTKPKPEQKPEKKPTTEEEKPTTEEDEQLKEPNLPDDIKNIAYHLEVSIDSISESKSLIKRVMGSVFFCCTGSRQYGLYLMNLYFVTKILYIINIICQFLILNSFIGSSYRFFGFEVLKDILQGNYWKSTGHFPRVTLCDFQVRSLGNRRNYTVECVLPINLFNEKIYIFLWFWFFFVAILTILSLFQWISRMIYGNRSEFIKNMILKFQSEWSNHDIILLESFLAKRLKSDGILLIYLIYLNAGDIVTKEIVEMMWFMHKRRNPPINSQSDSNDDGHLTFL